jgi:hypothetical protein
MSCKLVILFFLLCCGSYIKYVYCQQLQQSTSQKIEKNPSILSDFYVKQVCQIFAFRYQ